MDFTGTRQATRLDAIPGHFDPWLLGVSVALAALGVVMVASSSIALNANPFYFLTRHILFLAGGIALAGWARASMARVAGSTSASPAFRPWKR